MSNLTKFNNGISNQQQQHLLPSKRVAKLAIGSLALVLAAIAILLVLLSNRVNKLENTKVEVKHDYIEVNLETLYLQQQQLGSEIDTLKKLLFNTVLNLTEAEFKNSAETKKLLETIKNLETKQGKIEVEIEEAVKRQSNNFDLSLKFSSSQRGENRKFKPSDFISIYKDAFEDIFSKYHKIPRPNKKQYDLALTLSLAQGILESGWGGSDLAYYHNNWHGIKCQACGGVFRPDCTEVNSVSLNDDCSFDKFYKYRDLGTSVAAHYLLLFRPNSKYRKKVQKALKQPTLQSFAADGEVTDREFWKSDVGTLCKLLSGISPKPNYATNKKYHLRLKKLILNYKLYN